MDPRVQSHDLIFKRNDTARPVARQLRQCLYMESRCHSCRTRLAASLLAVAPIRDIYRVPRLSTQGGVAYAQRLGEVSATVAVDSLFTQAIMPTLFHQDPRSFRKQTGSKLSRINYAISRVAITQSDRGHSSFNISKVTGFAASTALSNMYVPAINRTAGQNSVAYSITLGIDCIVNILREFR